MLPITDKKLIHSVVIWQAAILLIFLALTVANEILDFPHLVFGDSATSWNQRGGEIAIEMIIFLVVIAPEIGLFRKLVRRIRILEGFLPICASCKRIRHENQWEQIESYITRHSLAQFSHSLCPECHQKLYPELFDYRR